MLQSRHVEQDYSLFTWDNYKFYILFLSVLISVSLSVCQTVNLSPVHRVCNAYLYAWVCQIDGSVWQIERILSGNCGIVVIIPWLVCCGCQSHRDSVEMSLLVCEGDFVMRRTPVIYVCFYCFISCKYAMLLTENFCGYVQIYIEMYVLCRQTLKHTHTHTHTHIHTHTHTHTHTHI